MATVVSKINFPGELIVKVQMPRAFPLRVFIAGRLIRLAGFVLGAQVDVSVVVE